MNSVRVRKWCSTCARLLDRSFGISKVCLLTGSADDCVCLARRSLHAACGMDFSLFCLHLPTSPYPKMVVMLHHTCLILLRRKLARPERGEDGSVRVY